jgi:hypothetical protein
VITVVEAGEASGASVEVLTLEEEMVVEEEDSERVESAAFCDCRSDTRWPSISLILAFQRALIYYFFVCVWVCMRKWEGLKNFKSVEGEIKERRELNCLFLSIHLVSSFFLVEVLCSPNFSLLILPQLKKERRGRNRTSCCGSSALG